MKLPFEGPLATEKLVTLTDGLTAEPTGLVVVEVLLVWLQSL